MARNRIIYRSESQFYLTTSIFDILVNHRKQELIAFNRYPKVNCNHLNVIFIQTKELLYGVISTWLTVKGR